MGNIIRIMLRDLRSISTNVVALVIIMGLCVIPSLYAWFNIHSNWDPYSEAATSNLKIAVFSKDQGMKVSDMMLTIGDSVVDALHENPCHFLLRAACAVRGVGLRLCLCHNRLAHHS